MTAPASDPIHVDRVDERTALVTIGHDPLGGAADDLADQVGGLLAEGTTRVVVEFGPGMLNSKLLDALVRASARPEAADGGIAVVVPRGYVRQLLLVSEAGGLLLLADTREEALEALDES